MEVVMNHAVMKAYSCEDLITKLLMLTGPISMRIVDLLPTHKRTYYNTSNDMVYRGLIRKKRKYGERYIVPTLTLMSSNEDNINKATYKDLIKDSRWLSMLDEKSKAEQIAFLTGAVVGDIKLVYEPDIFGRQKECDSAISVLFGDTDRVKTPENYFTSLDEAAKGEAIFIPGRYIKDPRNYRNLERVTDKRSPFLSRMQGLYKTKENSLYAVYIINNMDQFTWSKSKEREFVKFLQSPELVGREVKGMFITNSNTDADLLLKQRRTREDKKNNKSLVIPTNVFDEFITFSLENSERIKNQLGHL
jgi:hypothetical protein